MNETMVVSSLKWIHKSDILFVLLCTLLLSIPASYEPHHFAKVLFFGAFIQSLSYSLLLFLLTYKWRIVRLLAFSLLYALFSIETFTYIVFDSRFNPAILTLILQTSSQEISEFINIYLCTFKSVFIILLLLIFYILFFRLLYSKQTIRYKSIKTYIFVIGLILIGFSIDYYPLPFPIGNNTVNELLVSLRFVRDNRQDLDTIEDMFDKIQITQFPNASQSPTIVLIIGESFNKYHSSLYGYYLPTSQQLKKEQLSGRLIVFNQAMTPTNGTAFAMRYLFTLQSCGKNDKQLRCILMPFVFRKAGYEVAYFDNQYTRSSSGELDYSCVFFLNPQHINNSCFTYRNDETMPYDGDFINKYKHHFIKNNHSLNIIHLMGQHFDASQRYPKNYSIFTAEDIHRKDLDESQRLKIAEYDNATFYNDKVVSDIINQFRDLDAVIIYLSDHGEQIYDDDHHYFGRSFGSNKDSTTLKNVYQVPFMIWCSQRYQTTHPDHYRSICNASNSSLCIDDVPYLLFSLAGIDFNYNDKQRSIIDASYHHHQTIVE